MTQIYAKIQGIWRGLNNRTCGHGLLPGSAPGDPNVAVVSNASGDRVLLAPLSAKLS
jgi:hypothetical protein